MCPPFSLSTSRFLDLCDRAMRPLDGVNQPFREEPSDSRAFRLETSDSLRSPSSEIINQMTIPANMAAVDIQRIVGGVGDVLLLLCETHRQLACGS